MDAGAGTPAAVQGNASGGQTGEDRPAKVGDNVVVFATPGADTGQRATEAPSQAPQVVSVSGGTGAQFGQGTPDPRFSHKDSGDTPQIVPPAPSAGGVGAGSITGISTEPARAPLDAGARGDLLEQLAAHTGKLSSPGQSSVRVQLRPASLGTVDLNLSLKDGVLSLNIHTELSHTRDMIEAALPQLRHALSERGVDTTQVSLTSSSSSPSGDFAASGRWNGDQARGGEYYAPNRGYAVSATAPSDIAQLAAIESLSGDHTIDYRV